MNKTVMAVVVGLLIAGVGAYGAAMYGDKKIAAFYDGSIIKDKRMQIEGKSDMGLMGGTAKWTATLIPDLCSPDVHFKLRGEDTISRGLTGYQIESKIYVLPEKQAEEFFLLDASSKWNWSGNGSVQYRIPAGQYALNSLRESGQGQLTWSDMTASVNIKNGGQDGFQAADWVFHIPEVALKESSGKDIFLLQNMDVKSEGALNQTIGTGKGEVSLGKLLLNADKMAFELQNLRQTSTQNSTDKVADVLSETTIGSLRYQNQVFNDFKFNMNIKGISQAALQKWLAFDKRQGQECVKPSEVQKELEQSALLMLKDGFSIESKGNQVSLNGNQATLDMAATVPAGEYANSQEVMRKLPEKLQYSLNATVAKSLLDSLGIFNQAGVPMSDADWDAMLMQVPPPFKAVREGQTIKLSVQK
ncbi:MAG: DUF945 family protein [Alysiella sp.]|uniref:DUF945 family protein n=1 Tax=Alysiella sp. TaxID=1872483 RepID=UPI0026DBC1F8|nr:DUF945 family protein [Alysiella sp.]MDO4433699.1 DUF945 family protein [Alysiella sp.]